MIKINEKCSADDCLRIPHCQELCRMHYRRKKSGLDINASTGRANKGGINDSKPRAKRLNTGGNDHIDKFSPKKMMDMLNAAMKAPHRLSADQSD